MGELYQAIILGIVEGLTEFLPVSSTGHLILASHFMGLEGEAIKSFEIIIQLGAILAIVVIYRQRFLGLLRSDPHKKFSGFHGLWLLFITCLPAGLLGLFTHSYIEENLFGPFTVVPALAVGAILMILLERFKPAPKVYSLDEVTPRLALGIGLFQCLALWPGFSRSASTIMGGMLLKADRKTAADYSFIAAVPLMFAATGYSLLKSWHNIFNDNFTFFAVGFIVSFVSAWAAVKIFIALLSKIGLVPFAIYRLALAAVVAYTLMA